MALPVLPLLAAGLLGYAGYRAAKIAIDAAGRDRRRRDWFVVQDPEARAAGEGKAARGGGGGGQAEGRAWRRGNVLSTAYEFDGGAVRFRHLGDARRYAGRFGLAAPLIPPP